MRLLPHKITEDFIMDLARIVVKDTKPQDLAVRLQTIISEQGRDVLSSDPFSVYTRLTEDGVPSNFSGALLVTLLSGIHLEAEQNSQSKLSEMIREKCFLSAPISDFLADMYRRLLNDNLKELPDGVSAGFGELCSKEWQYRAYCDSAWSPSGGVLPMEYFCDVSLVYGVQDVEKAQLYLKLSLDNNPFAAVEDLCEEIEDDLDEVIQKRLDEWVTGDPHHEPDMRGFRSECRKVIEKFFEKKGLKLVMYDCYIGDDDF